MDQRGGLQRVNVALAAQVPARDLSQLFVDQRQQLIHGLGIARTPSVQQQVRNLGCQCVVRELIGDKSLNRF